MTIILCAGLPCLLSLLFMWTLVTFIFSLSGAKRNVKDSLDEMTAIFLFPLGLVN